MMIRLKNTQKTNIFFYLLNQKVGEFKKEKYIKKEPNK